MSAKVLCFVVDKKLVCFVVSKKQAFRNKRNSREISYTTICGKGKIYFPQFTKQKHRRNDKWFEENFFYDSTNLRCCFPPVGN